MSLSLPLRAAWRATRHHARVCTLGLAWAVACWPLQGSAAPVVAPADLQPRLQQAARAFTVVEPHLSVKGQHTQVQYLGWPANAVFDVLLGPSWQAPGHDVVFQALDGYVSRIPTERFSQYTAYLVHQRVGQAQFTVDNLAQNQPNVPLGPYYLVWDNVKSPELLPEGGSFWPYQVNDISVQPSRLQALLPGNLAERYQGVATDVQKLCLSCHQINGFGGNKWPGNLAQLARSLGDDTFLRWVLAPSSLKPGTQMPPVADQRPQAEREVLARQILDYLKAQPPSTP
ncbi:MAG TPA: hypothetical protein VFY35_02685 [Burkholderiaceae bacterium]|nr:hypothetical protein [Burkholderiaceae bacterium]